MGRLETPGGGFYKMAQVKSEQALRSRFALNSRRALKRKARALERLLGGATKLFGAKASESGVPLTVTPPGKCPDPIVGKLVLMRTRWKGRLPDVG